MKRAALALVAGLLFLFVGAAAALAHTELISMDPADGAQLATLPKKASFTFAEPTKSVSVVLTTPEERVMNLAVRVVGAQVKAIMPSRGPRGDYTLAYRAVAADGHVVTGSAQFSVAAGPDPQVSVLTPGGSSADSPGLPVRDVVAGAVLLLLIGGALVLVRSRR